MKLELNKEDLVPLVEQVVQEVLQRTEAARATLVADRLAYPEAEAASLLGVRPHVLRDARMKGELESTRVGKRVAYTQRDLLRYLERNRLANKRGC